MASVPSHPAQHSSPEDDPEGAVLPEPQFPTRPWGYDRAAVDAYVDRTEAVVADALAERTPEGAVKAALDRLGDETSAVLQNAHKIADEITDRSRRQADQRLERAEQEAEEIKRAAEQRVASLDAELDKLWQERQRLLADMERISVDLHALVTGADERFPVEEDETEGDGVVAEEPGVAGDADAALEEGEPASEPVTQVFEPVGDDAGAEDEAPAPDADSQRSPNATG